MNSRNPNNPTHGNSEEYKKESSDYIKKLDGYLKKSDLPRVWPEGVIATATYTNPQSYIDPSQSKKGKLPLAEVHPQFLNSLARVSEVSKAKGYEELNWIKPDVKCYFVSYLCSAALRHINDFLNGKDHNIELDQNQKPIDQFDVLHVECAAYNLLMIATLFRLNRADLDDRKINKVTGDNNDKVD